MVMTLVEIRFKSRADADYFNAKFEEISGEIKALQHKPGEHAQQILTRQNTHTEISELLNIIEQLNLSVKECRDDAVKAIIDNGSIYRGR